MKTLLLTTPQADLEKNAFGDLLRENPAGWRVEARPSGSLNEIVGTPTVTLVRVGDRTRPAELKALIAQLAHLQAGISQGSFVVFAIKRQAQVALQGVKAQQRRLHAIVQQINTSLGEFPNPDRVDVVEDAPDLTAKLSLIDAKLRITLRPTAQSPRPSPLDRIKEALTATEDLRVANGNLSAAAVAAAFGVSLNQLADWLGRTRQALNKTPDADSLQDELGFFERVARLRTVIPRERFLKWLRMANSELDGKRPLDLLASGESQVVADLVDDMLTGAPT